MQLAILVTVLFVSFAVVFARPPAGLYGLSMNEGLLLINETTAKATPIGIPVPHVEEAQNLATIDRVHGILYTIYFNITTSAPDVVGVDLNTGKVLSHVALHIPEAAFVGVGQMIEFDSIRNVVYVAAAVSKTQHKILVVNPVTGAAKTLHTLDNYVDFLGPYHAYDPIHQILWLQYAIVKDNRAIDSRIGINVSTGAVQYDQENTIGFSTLDFDPYTHMLYGIGYAVNDKYPNGVRTVLSLNSADGSAKLIGYNPDWWMISSSIAAYDPIHKHLFAIMQKKGVPTNDTKFDLAVINAVTGATVSGAYLCPNDAECPWSLEYYVPSHDRKFIPY